MRVFLYRIIQRFRPGSNRNSGSCSPAPYPIWLRNHGVSRRSRTVIFRITIWHPYHWKSDTAASAGFEPTSSGSEPDVLTVRRRCYGRSERNRTSVCGFGDRCSSTELPTCILLKSASLKHVSVKWTRKGSNLRREALQASALPVELQVHGLFLKCARRESDPEPSD